jgi:hypothetical protein
LAEGSIVDIIISIVKQGDGSVVGLSIIHLLFVQEIVLERETHCVDELLSRFSSLVLDHNAQNFVRKDAFQLNNNFMRVAEFNHVNEFLVAVDEGSELAFFKVSVWLEVNVVQVDNQLMSDPLSTLTRFEVNTSMNYLLILNYYLIIDLYQRFKM